LGLTTHWRDGLFKLQWTRRLLMLRRTFPVVFTQGNYRQLDVRGPHSDHVIAYAREHRRDALIVGRTPQQSRELLEQLWAAVFLLPDKWLVPLEANDFVIFDNRAVLHNREGWDASRQRIVFHLAIEGEVPLPAFPDARA